MSSKRWFTVGGFVLTSVVGALVAWADKMSHPVWGLLVMLACAGLLACVYGLFVAGREKKERAASRLLAKQEAIAAVDLSVAQQPVTCMGPDCGRELSRGGAKELPGYGFLCSECYALFSTKPHP